MTRIEEYVEKLNGPEEAERVYAAEDIGYANSAAGVMPLVDRLFREPSLQVRDAIFQALIRIESDAAIEGSVLLLRSEDPQIRNQAVYVLRHKGASAIPFLGQPMREGNEHLRKLVLDVISGIPSREAEEIYAAALADPDLNVLITAVETLGRLRAAKFQSAIEDRIIPGAHPMLLAACLEALVGVGSEASLAVIGRVFPDITAVPDFLLGSYLKAIAALGSGDAFEQVANLLKARGKHLLPAILGTLQVLSPRCRPQALEDTLFVNLAAAVEDRDSPFCRYQAIQILSLWPDREDVRGLLIASLSSDDRLVRLAAAEGLRGTKDPRLIPILAAQPGHGFDEELFEALGR